MIKTGFLVVCAILFGLSTVATADLKTNGKGKDRVLDPGQFSGKRMVQHNIFVKSCTKCHDMARPVSALLTGVTPISGSSFEDKYIKMYVVKMMRKPNSGVSRKNAKQLISFLQHARELAKESAESRPGYID